MALSTDLLSPSGKFYAASIVYIVSIAISEICSVKDHASTLQSQLLSWCILYGIVKGREILPGKKHGRREVATAKSPAGSDKLALALAAASILSAIELVSWALPLLIPFLWHLGNERSYPTKPIVDEKEAAPNESIVLVNEIPTLLIHLVIASLCSYALLPDRISPFGVFAGVAWGLCQLYIVVRIFQNPCDSDCSPATLESMVPSDVRVRVIVIIVIGIVAGQREAFESSPSTALAVGTSMRWMSYIFLIRLNHVVPIATMGTATTATVLACNKQYELATLLLTLVPIFVGLFQTYHACPNILYRRRALIALSGLVLVLISMRQLHRDNVDPPKVRFSGLFSPEVHPVETLVTEAKRKFEGRLRRQSQTLSQAVAEYERRYQMSPPPGFDTWFEFAKQSKSLIVDDYDTMTDCFRPFWGLSSVEIQRRLELIGNERVANFSIRNHTLTMPSDTAVIGNFQPTIKLWIENHIDILPDIDVIMNGLAEPRVFIPHDELSQLLTTCPSDDAPLDLDKTVQQHPLEWLDLGRNTARDVGIRACAIDSPSRGVNAPSLSCDRSTGLPLPFVINATLAKSWCDQPHAFRSHALFLSPFNLHVTSTLLPIFTHGKPSSAQDLLYPAPDYASASAQTDGAPSGLPWENRSNTFYWAGQDTGGYATPSTWRNLHRQRFVAFLTNTANPATNLTPYKASRFSSFMWAPMNDTIAHISHMLKVHFSSITLCDPSICKEENAALPVGPKDPPEELQKHKFLFDIDGMGRTERFYKLLASGGCVLKQTMHQEWHDDRLVPWVHYVPVSLGMEELPELIRWLGSTKEGEEVGRGIAERGRWWRENLGRDVDLEVAFLRGLLEYARVVRGDRRRDRDCGRWRRGKGKGKGM